MTLESCQLHEGVNTEGVCLFQEWTPLCPSCFFLEKESFINLRQLHQDDTITFVPLVHVQKECSSTNQYDHSLPYFAFHFLLTICYQSRTL